MEPSSPHPISHQTLDARGLLCPEPLMLVRNRLRAMAVGEILQIIATDPSTERDFNNLCRFMGHSLIAIERDAAALRFWISKG